MIFDPGTRTLMSTPGKGTFPACPSVVTILTLGSGEVVVGGSVVAVGGSVVVGGCGPVVFGIVVVETFAVGVVVSTVVAGVKAGGKIIKNQYPT